MDKYNSKHTGEQIDEAVDAFLGNGTNGKDGGYYTPTAVQTDAETMRFSFSASKETMPAVSPVLVKLPQGAPGKTPVKGADYWTDADQESIVQQVIAALGTPVFGRVDADNNIILTGELAKATYTVKYENADGTLTEIGTIGFAYTNLADQTSGDWMNDTRINSSGEIKPAAGVDLTNFIALPSGAKKIHIKGLDIVSALPDGDNYGRVYCYNAAKTQTDYKQPSVLPQYFYTADYDDTVFIVDLEAARSTSSMNTMTGAAYLRFCGIPTAENIVITIDENIV